MHFYSDYSYCGNMLNGTLYGYTIVYGIVHNEIAAQGDSEAHSSPTL